MNHNEYLKSILEMPINECIDHYHDLLEFYSDDVEPLLLDDESIKTLFDKIHKRVHSNPDALMKRIAFYRQSFTDALK